MFFHNSNWPRYQNRIFCIFIDLKEIVWSLIFSQNMCVLQNREIIFNDSIQKWMWLFSVIKILIDFNNFIIGFLFLVFKTQILYFDISTLKNTIWIWFIEWSFIYVLVHHILWVFSFFKIIINICFSLIFLFIYHLNLSFVLLFICTLYILNFLWWCWIWKFRPWLNFFIRTTINILI